MKLQLKPDLWRDYTSYSFRDGIGWLNFATVQKDGVRHDHDELYDDYMEQSKKTYAGMSQATILESLQADLYALYKLDSPLITTECADLLLNFGYNSNIHLIIKASESGAYILTNDNNHDKIATCATMQDAKDVAEDYVYGLIGKYFEIV
jgi:hypothetical protein